ncbi:MAG: hypothetical protein ABSA17_07000 [Rhabdochlamydiaceae bacterium]
MTLIFLIANYEYVVGDDMIPHSGNAAGEPNRSMFYSGLLNSTADAKTVGVDFFSLFDKQIINSQQARLLKVAKLTPDQKVKLLKLEDKLTLVHQNIPTLQSLENGTISPNDREKHRLTEQIQQLEEEIHEEFTPFLFQARTALKFPYEFNFTFYSETVLNAFVNRASYINEIRNTVNGELERILSFFNLPPCKMSEEIEFPPNESHNEGRVTCFCYLENENTRTKLVFKPRNARVDDLVISTFRRINGLPIKDKSIDNDSKNFNLPFYQIYHCEQENSSIWECISGQTLRKSYVKAPTSLGNYISDMSDEVLIKVVRMDEVLSLLHISDLHGENIIFRKDINNLKEFIPIDLEVVLFPKNPEQATKTELGVQNIRQKLIQENKYKGLTDAEKAIIREMRRGFFDHISRFVPLGTYHLVKQLFELSNYKLIADLFEKTITNEGYIPDKDINKLLQENILLDYLNNDVPYLSSKEGNLYYGNPNKNVLLAKIGR